MPGQAPGRLLQVPRTHDVVPIEHAARLVPGDRHGDPLGHPRVDEVPPPSEEDQERRPETGPAIYGRHGPARVRRTGRGIRQRWFVMAPLDTGELLTCVLRAALPRDLRAEDTFVVSSEGLLEAPGRLDPSMRLCVSARVAMEDEVRSYRRWRVSKGGR